MCENFPCETLTSVAMNISIKGHIQNFTVTLLIQDRSLYVYIIMNFNTLDVLQLYLYICTIDVYI